MIKIFIIIIMIIFNYQNVYPFGWGYVYYAGAVNNNEMEEKRRRENRDDRHYERHINIKSSRIYVCHFTKNMKKIINVNSKCLF